MRFWKYSLPRVLGIIAIGVLMSRCGDDKVEPKYSSLYKHFFSGCGQVGCHVSGEEAYNKVAADMSGGKDSVYSILQSSSLTYNPPYSNCSGVKIVAPSDYDHSQIKGLVGTNSERSEFQTASGGCATYAKDNHTFSPPLTDAVKAALVEWIAAGALNN